METLSLTLTHAQRLLLLGFALPLRQTLQLLGEELLTLTASLSQQRLLGAPLALLVVVKALARPSPAQRQPRSRRWRAGTMTRRPAI